MQDFDESKFIFQTIYLNSIPIVMKTFLLEVSQFHFGMDNIFLFVFARLGLIQEWNILNLPSIHININFSHFNYFCGISNIKFYHTLYENKGIKEIDIFEFQVGYQNIYLALILIKIIRCIYLSVVIFFKTNSMFLS